MQRALIVATAALALLGAGARAQTADEIIAAADRVRNPGQPFRLLDTLTEYVGGKPGNRIVLAVNSKLDPATGQFRNLIRYVEPPRDAGKMVLLNGSSLWFYDPATKASVRISPQQRLLGQAATGDVLSVNLARDYKAKLVGAERLQDAERQERDSWHLDLAAATPDAIYSRIEFWMERGSNRALKGKFYADSGRLLKIAYYRKYEQQLGGYRPSETIIIDAIDSQLVTKMAFSDFRAQEIPEAWFQRESLSRLATE